MEQQLKVSAIKNGTVIDHILPSSLFKVISILHLEECNNMITFGNNLDSKVYKNKAIIKVANRFFKDDEINKIALVSPNAKLSTIKNYKVVEKRLVQVPEKIKDIVKCINPQCITNEEDITTRFQVIAEGNSMSFKCRYCEKIMHSDEIVIK